MAARKFKSLKTCRRSKRYEKCVRAVKESSPRVNPWAVCTVSVCRKNRNRR